MPGLSMDSMNRRSQCRPSLLLMNTESAVPGHGESSLGFLCGEKRRGKAR